MYCLSTVQGLHQKGMKLFFLLFIFVFPVLSQSELSSPLFLSQGGAGGASLKEDFSYLLNPATIAFQNKNKAAMAYSFKKQEQRALLSFVDLKTKIPMAVTYQRDWSDSFTKSKNDKMFVSSGIKFSRYFGLGLTAEKELKKTTWNGSLGSILRIGNQISLALFLNQILKKENQNQRSLSFAAYHNWKNFFSTKIDISKTAHQKWIFRGGVESLFQNFFSIRLGGTWFQKNKKGLLSGGWAFQSPKFLLEYSLEANQKIYQQAFVLILRI